MPKLYFDLPDTQLLQELVACCCAGMHSHASHRRGASAAECPGADKCFVAFHTSKLEGPCQVQGEGLSALFVMQLVS